MPIIIQETSNRVHEPTNIILCIWINRTLLVLYDWRSLQRYKAKKCVEFLAIDVNYVYVFVYELVAYLPSCHHNHHSFVKTRAQIISIQLKAYSVQQDTVANRFVHSFVLWFEIRSASYFFCYCVFFRFFHASTDACSVSTLCQDCQHFNERFNIEYIFQRTAVKIIADNTLKLF